VKLVVVEPGSITTEYSLSPGSYLIGRRGQQNKVDIPLSGRNVSRRHATLVVESGRCRLVDVGSKNGTYVNGLRVESLLLSSGDVISIGDNRLLFVEQPAESPAAIASARPSSVRAAPSGETDGAAASLVELTDAESIVDATGAFSRPVDELIEPICVASPRLPEAGRGEYPAELVQLHKKTQILSVLYQASKALISARSLDVVLEKVMDLVFDTIRAQRGFLMLVDERTGGWVPRKVRCSPEVRDRGKIVLSKSIAGKAMSEKKAILISDALVHPRFSSQESVRLLGIRSAMCVPLTYMDKVLGLIYLDTSDKRCRFTQDDLDMLTALGNHAAIAIYQAQLDQRIASQEEFRRKMARYHPPAVIQRIMERSEDVLDVQEANVTVLFADIKDFTVFCETHSPGTVRDMLNEYFGRMTEIIFRREGTLDKYIADEILAVFGVPFAHPDDADRALLTALEMREALAGLNASRPVDMRFSVKIGINSGRVLVGDIGCLRRMDYTVLGGPVNIAKRIETLAEPDQILLGQSTYELVSKELFDLRAFKTLSLKGKSEPIQLWEVSGLAASDGQTSPGRV